MLYMVVLCVIPYVVLYQVLYAFPNPGTTGNTISVALIIVFRIIALPFNILMGLFHVGGVAAFASGQDGVSSIFSTTNAWSATDGGALVDIIFILCHTAVQISLLYLKESRTLKRKVSTANIQWDADIKGSGAEIDKDVLEEERLAMADKTSPLCLQRVRKMYKNGRFIAVRSSSLVVKLWECFGLLGLNGAGKTTIMNITAGILAPSEGKALLRGYNPMENPSIVADRLAMNPQHDDIFPELTARESIIFCAKLVGYAEGPPLTAWVEKYIELNGLTEHAGKKGKSLSGGNKRKVRDLFWLLFLRKLLHLPLLIFCTSCPL